MKKPVSLPVYQPVWLYRLVRFWEKLPTWWIFLFSVIFTATALHLEAWRLGYLEFGQFHTYLLSVGVYFFICLILWVVLDHRAAGAIREFYSRQKLSKSALENKVADFLSLPPIPGTAAFVLGGFLGWLTYTQFAVPLMPFADKVLPIFNMMSWVASTAFAFILLYRAFRQAGLIAKMFEGLDVDIYNPRPIYALSNFGATTSFIGILMIYGLVFITFPQFFFSPIGWIYQFLVAFVGLGLFFLPLIRINQAMRRAKARLLEELGEDLKHTQQRLHDLLSKKKVVGMSELRHAIEALKIQTELVQRISTWPWQPETLRNLVTPLFFPVVVYVFQRYVGVFLGF